MAKPASTTARGYGAEHRRERRRIEIIVNAQGYVCTRCHQYRPPGSPFDLDHSDDRTTYRGPSCITCNRGAGGRKARAKERTRIIRSRIW
jgi:hypothetical protein